MHRGGRERLFLKLADRHGGVRLRCPGRTNPDNDLDILVEFDQRTAMPRQSGLTVAWLEQAEGPSDDGETRI